MKIAMTEKIRMPAIITATNNFTIFVQRFEQGHSALARRVCQFLLPDKGRIFKRGEGALEITRHEAARLNLGREWGGKFFYSGVRADSTEPNIFLSASSSCSRLLARTGLESHSFSGGHPPRHSWEGDTLASSDTRARR